MSNAAVRPWLALWLRPRLAIGSVVASRRGATTLLLALAAPLAATAAALFGATDLSGVSSGEAIRVAAIGALAVVALALAGFYVGGWLLNAVSRLIGGRGSPKATRAALAWSSVPQLVASLVALAAAGELASVGTLAQAVASLWSFGLLVAMLSHVQQFGRLRALASLLLGAMAPALILALVVRTLLFQPFNTPSGSMSPTLQTGDYFFVAKFEYGYARASFPFAVASFPGRIFAQTARRGDVVVFRHGGADWVKRVVGLPGDRIQLKAGRLYINGAIVERRAVEPGFRLLDGRDQGTTAPTYDEILPGGVTHRILQLAGDVGPSSNTDAFAVPPASYFVLGDNRDNSTDSRMPDLGFVSNDDLIGRAALIFFSSARGGPRLGRVGTAIQ